MSAFMAQTGTLVVCGDAGEALGDSIYEARLYVRGSVASLGADCVEKELRDEHIVQLGSLLEVAGVDAAEELLDRFEEELVRAMGSRLDLLETHGRALPGTHQALEHLHGEAQVVQSLLTGNVERNAMLKLQPFGLARFIEFGCGAYGSDHRVRGELVAIARQRTRQAHGADPADVVLIGDTPLDVAAAREGGARAVAVATGPFDEGQLAESGADAVLPDLSDTERVTEAVLGKT
jgi:phosphoglycolate phosphatase-like HAD superfamily hydrolase